MDASRPGYALIGLMSSFVLRAARDPVPHDLVTQERITGALLSAVAVTDVGFDQLSSP
jgi:hypothetical protein